MLGVSLALLMGKPLGVLVSSWTLVRLGWCRLPEGMTWSWMWLIGCLAGIRFTMSIFIASLAFNDDSLLSATKLGVLLASAVAGVIGLVFGRIIVLRMKVAEGLPGTRPSE